MAWENGEFVNIRQMSKLLNYPCENINRSRNLKQIIGGENWFRKEREKETFSTSADTQTEASQSRLMFDINYNRMNRKSVEPWILNEGNFLPLQFFPQGRKRKTFHSINCRLPFEHIIAKRKRFRRKKYIKHLMKYFFYDSLLCQTVQNRERRAHK